jgi:hypothetical protein
MRLRSSAVILAEIERRIEALAIPTENGHVRRRELEKLRDWIKGEEQS